MRTMEVAGDVVAAGSALAGLILVYLGAITASFGSFQPAERRAVLAQHQRRVWFAFVGIVLCLVSVALGIFGKWLEVDCLVIGAIALLTLGLVWLVGAALLSVFEVK